MNAPAKTRWSLLARLLVTLWVASVFLEGLLCHWVYGMGHSLNWLDWTTDLVSAALVGGVVWRGTKRVIA